VGSEASVMALTQFGIAVRKARLETGYTLLTMSNELDTTPAYLSALETGTKKIPKKWVEKIYEFFSAKGIELDELDQLANVANKSVPIDGLSDQQQMLVAGFAKSSFTNEQLLKFASLLTEVNGKKD
jgi:transcriptional regulator with XRE-family HTH domain